MKKFLLFSFLVFLGLFFNGRPSFCANSDGETSWNEMLEFDRSWQTKHEAVTDKEFEEVMQRFEKKKNKKKKKYEFEANEEKDSLNDMSILNDIANHSPVILFPTKLRSYEGEVIPAGYYKLNYNEKDNEHYLFVTQGRNIVAKLKMQPTNENFESDSIQFAEIRPNDSESMKLIYGNIDLNLEKKLYILY